MKNLMAPLALAITAALAMASAACSTSSSSGAAPSCQVIESTMCSGAEAVQLCSTAGSDGTCASSFYSVGAQTFDCVSCTDTAECFAAAIQACLGDSGFALPDADGVTLDATTADAGADDTGITMTDGSIVPFETGVVTLDGGMEAGDGASIEGGVRQGDGAPE